MLEEAFQMRCVQNRSFPLLPQFSNSRSCLLSSVRKCTLFLGAKPHLHRLHCPSVRAHCLLYNGARFEKILESINEIEIGGRKNEWVTKIRCVKGSALGRYGERHGGKTNLLDIYYKIATKTEGWLKGQQVDSPRRYSLIDMV